MLEAAQSSTLCRCPTCGRLVTVPRDARAKQVACPICRHQDEGGAFADVEPPLPVILLSDEARTHLLLDVAPIDEGPDLDPATRMMDATSLRHSAARPATTAARGAAVDGEEARTHLLLGLDDVHEEPERGGALAPVLSRVRRVMPPLLRLSTWLDEVLHERWPLAFVALAVVCGFIAPVIDYVITGRATLYAVTWLSVSAGFAALGIARASGLRSDDGEWDPRVVATRVRALVRLMIEGFERLPEAPAYVKQSIVAQALALVGLSGLAWAGLLAGFRLLFGAAASPSALPFVSGLLLLAAVGLRKFASSSAPPLRFSLQETGNSLAAAAQLPAIIDLSEPLPEAFRAGATTLHKTLLALARWIPYQWPDEASYRAALELHLQCYLPACRIERERWVGRSRGDGVIDLIVDGVVVIGIERGFDDARAQRAITKIRNYARSWSGKPLLLAVFDAPRARVTGSSHSASLLQLHEQLAAITVRMPKHG